VTEKVTFIIKYFKNMSNWQVLSSTITAPSGNGLYSPMFFSGVVFGNGIPSFLNSYSIFPKPLFFTHPNELIIKKPLAEYKTRGFV
jgi:hypothetical protein